VRGVQQVTCGYTGGQTPNPSYEQVCSGQTGHAEAVQILFDPQIIAYRTLLDIFFAIHDPTTLNRQGADVGTQYRSAIFWHDETQRRIAENAIAELDAAGIWPNPIVTEVQPFTIFYPAEDYHQNYFARNPWQPYCQVVINPKVGKFRQKFSQWLADGTNKTP
jgi:peptide-methionine (S)-S-oxide reductase